MRELRYRVGSPVILSYKGARGHAPPYFFDKNGAICSILSVPKYLNINLKINNFKDNKSTTNQIIFAIFFSKINQDAHVSTKINTFKFYKGV